MSLKYPCVCSFLDHVKTWHKTSAFRKKRRSRNRSRCIIYFDFHFQKHWSTVESQPSHRSIASLTTMSTDFEALCVEGNESQEICDLYAVSEKDVNGRSENKNDSNSVSPNVILRNAPLRSQRMLLLTFFRLGYINTRQLISPSDGSEADAIAGLTTGINTFFLLFAVS